MSEGQLPNADTPGVYDVQKSDFSKIRFYFGLRAVLFVTCFVICASALTPNDSLSNPTLGMLSGLVLLVGLFVALRYSKPVIGMAFGISRFRVPIPFWHALGIVMALAYAAHGRNYLDKSIAFPVFGIAGILFFGIPLWTAARLVFKPAQGGAMMQMAEEFRARKGS